MITYRVALKIGYHERWFEFCDLSKAGEFAKIILINQVINEDHKDQQLTVSIEVVQSDATTRGSAFESEDMICGKSPSAIDYYSQTDMEFQTTSV